MFLRWKHHNHRAWIDIFDARDFYEKGTLEWHTHDILNVNTLKSCPSACSLTVDDLQVELNYAASASIIDFNNERSITLGQLRLVFHDSSRSKIKSAEWRDSGKKIYRRGLAEPLEDISNELPQFKDFISARGDKTTTFRKVKCRDGQSAFRELQIALRQECAISGCRVRDALQAAHIEAHVNQSSNHVRNGIVLRADLHALFDAQLIGINPDTRKVHISKKILGDANYRSLHGKDVSHLFEGPYAISIAATINTWKNSGLLNE